MQTLSRVSFTPQDGSHPHPNPQSQSHANGNANASTNRFPLPDFDASIFLDTGMMGIESGVFDSPGSQRLDPLSNDLTQVRLLRLPRHGTR